MKDLANIYNIYSLIFIAIARLGTGTRRVYYKALLSQFRFVLCLVFVLPQMSLAAQAKMTDLRIVIDVSGSMKHNDPNNLRVPAVKLLIGLMPDGTRAGIWTFGKFVNMQVKHAKVDAAWKKNARIEAARIHSRGLYTNIEQALKNATASWKSGTKHGKFSRHLILLTDGMVDVSKNKKLNEASRQRILKQILPKLKNTGVKIHTIALSDQADHDLLKTLSVTTDGWYELIKDPDKLHRVFLRLFEKSSPTNSLPFKDNVFKVDKSISDMTVLSFSQNKQEARLISPAGKIYKEKSNANNINWFHEKEYDLITIKKPQQGEWRLDAAQDKDNRVMVVTNLSLSVNELPNNTLLNEAVLINAQLQQNNKTITRQKFLKLISIEAKREALDVPVYVKRLRDNGKDADNKKNDGIYHVVINSTLKPGTYEITVTAKGPTFERQFKHLVNVFDGLATIKVKQTNNTDPYKIHITPHKGLLIPGSIVISQQLENGKTRKFKLAKENLWELLVAADKKGKMISILVKGLRQNNKSIEMQMERVMPDSNNNKNKRSDKLGKSTNGIEKKSEQKKSSWVTIMLWVLLVNVLVIGIAGLAYMVVKKIREKKLALEQAELKL